MAEAEEQRRKKISYGDAMQNPREIDILETISHTPHVKNAQKEQNQRTDGDPFHGSEAASALDHPADREDERNPYNKNE